MNINPFATDPSLSQYTNSTSSAGSTPSLNIGDGDNFDSLLNSEMTLMQSSISMAMDKLKSPLHSVHTLLDKIKKNEHITNTDSVANSLLTIANELSTSLNATAVPDQSKVVALKEVLKGLSSLVEKYGSKKALENLTLLYSDFDVNSLGHQQVKVEFVRWTRIETFRFNGSNSTDSEAVKADNLDKTQKLQSMLASFVESIKDEDIAYPLLPFFGSSSYMDHALEKYPLVIKDVMDVDTEDGITDTEEADSVEEMEEIS